MSRTDRSIVDHRYVSFTTSSKNGTAVATPVWTAPLGDGTAGFTTDLDSGKATRLRNNTAVTLRPCDARGRVADGADDAMTVEAIFVVVTGADVRRARSAITAKYKVLGALLGTFAMIGATLERSVRTNAAAVIITLP